MIVYLKMIMEIILFIASVLAMFFCIWRSHVNFGYYKDAHHVRLGYVYLALSFFAMLALAAQIFGGQ